MKESHYDLMAAIVLMVMFCGAALFLAGGFYH